MWGNRGCPRFGAALVGNELRCFNQKCYSRAHSATTPHNPRTVGVGFGNHFMSSDISERMAETGYLAVIIVPESWRSAIN